MKGLQNSWTPNRTPEDRSLDVAEMALSSPAERTDGGNGALWVRSGDALWRTVLDDVVLVAAGGGHEPIAVSNGASLWNLLAQPRTVKELGIGMAGLTDPERVRHQLTDLLSELERLGLVSRVG